MVWIIGERRGRGVVGNVAIGRIVGRGVSAMARTNGAIMRSGPPLAAVIVVGCGSNRGCDIVAGPELGSVLLGIVYPGGDATLGGEVAFVRLWGIIVLGHGDVEEQVEEQKQAAGAFNNKRARSDGAVCNCNHTKDAMIKAVHLTLRSAQYNTEYRPAGYRRRPKFRALTRSPPSLRLELNGVMVTPSTDLEGTSSGTDRFAKSSSLYRLANSSSSRFENGTTCPLTDLTAMSEGMPRAYTTTISRGSGERSTTLGR